MNGRNSRQIPKEGINPDNFLCSSQLGMSGSLSRELCRKPPIADLKPMRIWEYFRSWEGQRFFAALEYISTVKKNSISVIDVTQAAFEGNPFIPERTLIAV
jgi:hypothetical protein